MKLHLLFGLAGLMFAAIRADASAGVTYHGRLMKPDGTPVTSSSVTFRLQIRTPGNENCLMYEEQQVKDLSQSGGVFAITINDGSATVVNIEPFLLDRAFQNRGTFTFAGGKCTSGGTYTPNPTDGRKLVVEFNDGSFGGFEQMPAQAINYVPMAIESMTVGGFNASSLMRVVDGSGAPAAILPFTQTQHNTLLDLANGTGNIGGNAGGFTGSLSGDVTGGQSSTVVARIQGRPVDSAAPLNGQALVWSTANNRWQPESVSGGGGAGSVTQVATDASLTGGPISSTGTLGIAPDGVQTSHIADGQVTDAKIVSVAVDKILSASGKYLTYKPDASACVTGQVLKWDATGGGRWICGGDTNTDVLAALACASGDVPSFNGSVWSCVPSSVTAVTNSVVRRSGSGEIEASAAEVGSLRVNNGAGSAVTLQTPAAFTSYNLVLPSGSGTNGQILTSNGTDMIWSNASSITASNVSGIVAVANGGTGASTASAARTNLGATATGSSLFTAADAATARTAIGAMANVAPGSNGNVLTVAGGVWTSAPFTVNAANVGSSVGGYFAYKPNNGACAVGEVLKWSAANGGSWLCGTDISSTGGTGVASVSATAPVTVDNTDPNNPRVEISAASTSSAGVVQLATSSDTTASLVVQANDTRLADARVPSGGAGGDLGGNYPSPTIAKLQTKDITLTSLASGEVLKYNGTAWVNAPDVDSLGGLSCANGDAAVFSGGTWSCVNTSVASSNNSLVRRNGSGVITSAGGNFGSLQVNNGTSTVTLGTPAAFTSYTLKLPTSAGSNGQYLTSNGTDMVWSSLSIGAANFGAQAMNTVLAGPSSGGSGTPTFRSLAAADIPALDMAKITSGTLGLAQGGTGATTQSGAANAILPSQSSQSGKFLTTNGSVVSWATPGGDNLGNHTATQNMILGANWLSGDGGNEGIRIDADGRVGIGTATPAASLQVSGGAGLAVGASLTGDNAYTPPAASLVLSGASKTGLTTYPSPGNGTVLGVINNYSLDAGGGWARFLDIAALGSTGGAGANIRFLTGSTTADERMRIASDGNVGIGTAAPAPSALLEISSTNKGFLPPRMTTAQRDAISSPAAGLTVFNTTNGEFNFFNGSSWSSLINGTSSAQTAWVKIASAKASASTTSLSISGLNGDSDVVYRIITHIVQAGTGSPEYRITLNGDTGPNYGTRTMYSYDVSSVMSGGGPNETGLFVTASQGNGLVGTADVLLQAKSGTTRYGMFSWTNGITGESVSFLGQTSFSWANTSSNITSLQLTGSLSNRIGTGSYIEVWAQRNVGGNGGGDFYANGTVPMTGNIKLNGNFLSGDGDNEGVAVGSTGYVGINTSSPQSRLHIHESAAADSELRFTNAVSGGTEADGFTVGLGDGNGAYLWQKENSPIYIATNDTMRMTVLGNGNVGIGTDAPANLFTVNGTASKPGGGSWTATSDERLKNVHGAYGHGLREILQLNPVQFRYSEGNPRGLPSDQDYVGFLAQDVLCRRNERKQFLNEAGEVVTRAEDCAKIFPEAVTKGKDGFYDFDMHPINVAVINALKELYALFVEDQGETRREVAGLKAENAELKARNAAIQAYLCAKDPAAPFCAP